MITCYLRYRIDMYQLNQFEEYARMWIPLVKRFGGEHHGYFLPYESNSDLAVAIFSFPSLALYEIYRRDSASDSDCQAAYAFAEKTRCIISYERQFLRPILPVKTDEV
ncbi:MAG: NIPSNAP family protein [Planctomycetales bacterium]|nr:NIPSNAP family protein [Planctomycetales bacterium]